MNGANFTQADLTDASVARTNLRNANLSYTYLTRVEISSANTAGAILHGAMMPNGEIHD
jgi:uncharacterized protein YjbI with pentapeptide repeats